MSITSYTTLKTAVFDFSGRDDLSSKFSTIVQIAEDNIYNNDSQPLRTQELITTTTLSTVAGVNSVALPSGFISGLSMLIVVGGVKRELTNTAPASLHRNGESGIPCKYSITDAIVFDNVPDGAYSLELTYYARPATLDTVNNTNAILTAYPSIYLYACLASVSDLSGEDADAERFYQKMMRSIKGAIRSSRKLRYSPGASSTNRTWTP